MNKYHIIKALKKSHLVPRNTWFHRAACVFHGIYHSTNDIDILISDDIYAAHQFRGKLKNGEIHFLLSEDIEVFVRNMSNDDIVVLDGFRVCNKKSLFLQYQNLNREKDYARLLKLKD